MNGARGVIINVTGGPDLSLLEVSEASSIIHDAAHEEANIIFGAVVDPKMEGRVKITVIATGFDRGHARPRTSAAPTPVDLQSYTIRRQDGESAGIGARLARRSPVALTMPADPALAPAVGDGTEPSSPIDVPAFLRRLNEA